MTRDRDLLFLLLLTALPCCLSAQHSNADCANALFLCDKNPLTIKDLPHAGQHDEIQPLHN